MIRPLGKYKGKTWEEVAAIDRGYITWAEGNGLLPFGFKIPSAISIPNYILDGCNAEQRTVADLIIDGGNVIAPGIPGSGKSYVAKHLRGNVQALAPTGVAAMNIGGETFHAYFRIDPSDLLLRVKRSNLPSNTLWIFDEVFYSSAMILYRIVQVLTSKTRNPQFLFLGDPLQLESVERNGASANLLQEYDTEERKEIKELRKWKGKNIFDVLSHFNIPTTLIKLVKSVRHKDDTTFDFMNAARSATLSKEQLDAITVCKKPPENCVTLSYTNEVVDELNAKGLSRFNDRFFLPVTRVSNYANKAVTQKTIDDAVAPMWLKDKLTKSLKYYSKNFTPTEVAIGCRVMITKNIREDGKFIAVNGDTGIITERLDNVVKVRLDRTDAVVYVYTAFTGYSTYDKVWAIGVNKYPLKVCYAATIHKSQGMTISAPLHIRLCDQMKTKTGLLYTAITRAENIDKISLSLKLTNTYLPYRKEWTKLLTTNT